MYYGSQDIIVATLCDRIGFPSRFYMHHRLSGSRGRGKDEWPSVHKRVRRDASRPLLLRAGNKEREKGGGGMCIEEFHSA